VGACCALLLLYILAAVAHTVSWAHGCPDNAIQVLGVHAQSRCCLLTQTRSKLTPFPPPPDPCSDGSLRTYDFRTYNNIVGDYYIAPR
jgi:hypothetical protein